MKTKIKKINFHRFPDKFGRFGKFGGRFVAETLMPLLLEVESEYEKAKKSKINWIITLKITSADQVPYILPKDCQKN